MGGVSMAKNDSEVVIGIISPVGTDTSGVLTYITEHLRKFAYQTEVINVSEDILTKFEPSRYMATGEYDRICHYIELGNDVRERSGDNAILMKGVAAQIFEKRDSEDPAPRPRVAYIIKSIKHPEEVSFLRRLYGSGFHLLGVTSRHHDRIKYLTERKSIGQEDAEALLQRDANENLGHGQHTQDAFQDSDYFVVVDDSQARLRNSIYRLIDLLFGDPFITPSFDEFSMFMAYTSSLRSADLSRQIGAVITKSNEILSTGANDCPKAGGGLYWPVKQEDGQYIDEAKGRDYTLGYDSNKKEQSIMIDKILDALAVEKNPSNIKKVKNSGIGSLTEYGRVVHGEMEALLACSRNHISCRNATIYATTFPCHNCAKHIIAAGLERVVYIEPYPKSKALEFYQSEITEEIANHQGKVLFEPFVGVGPHRYMDLFSISSIQWDERIRKNSTGDKVEWKRQNASLRTPMQIFNYLESEKSAVVSFTEEVEALQQEADK